MFSSVVLDKKKMLSSLVPQSRCTVLACLPAYNQCLHIGCCNMYKNANNIITEKDAGNQRPVTTECAIIR